MRILAKRNNFKDCPSEMAAKGFFPESQTDITIGKEYEVHALSLFNGLLSFQIIDDYDYPSWLPSWLFDVIDSSLPDDWICNVFVGDSPHFVLGPIFVATDELSYANMVEMDPQSVECFWSRIKERCPSQE